MNKESKLCGKCRIRKSCPDALQPEIVDEYGAIKPIPHHYTHPSDRFCRHVMCETDGEEAAETALQKKKFINVRARVFPKTPPITIQLAIFGSLDKPTHKLELRGISPRGRVFSRDQEHGTFYPTGQWLRRR
ncbi:hypothetical protein KBC80_04975 [Candidatus Woesebacteria bacterium]|jgi:hypothetical protein|nr:hypothetical protein [Candidatus Woesebacteria bacterium]